MTAYDGDTNVPFYAVVAGIGNTQLSFSISYPQNTGLSVANVGNNVQATLNGPVRIRDTGTKIACSYSQNGVTYSQTATLTVLGKFGHFLNH